MASKKAGAGVGAGPGAQAPSETKVGPAPSLTPTGQEAAERIRRMLARLAAIPDDPPGSDQAFMEAVDRERPERPLFRGYY